MLMGTTYKIRNIQNVKAISLDGCKLMHVSCGYECESCFVLCIMFYFLCMLCKGGATLFRLRLSVASPPSIVFFDVF